MSLFDVQSMEWTAAARLLAVLAVTVTLSSSMLMFPCLTSFFYKVEPHTKKLFTSRFHELNHGSHTLLWSLAMVGGLVAGGAQVTCILLLPSMIVWTCYHYSAGGIPHAVLNFALAAALAYVGFVPFPMVPPLEWTPAAIYMTICTLMTLLAPLQCLMGGKATDSTYEQKPYLKDYFCDDEGLLPDVDFGEKAKNYRRARELGWAAHLLGSGCCMAAAVISGGAQDLCLLMVLPFFTNGYCHWLMREKHAEQKVGFILCWILTAAALGFGIAR